MEIFEEERAYVAPGLGVSLGREKKGGGNIPAAASGETCTFVSALWCLETYPCFDVCGVVHVKIVGDDIDVFYSNIHDG